MTLGWNIALKILYLLLNYSAHPWLKSWLRHCIYIILLFQHTNEQRCRFTCHIIRFSFLAERKRKKKNMAGSEQVQLQRVLRMNSGVGQTSYAKNSTMQVRFVSFSHKKIQVFDFVIPSCLILT